MQEPSRNNNVVDLREYAKTRRRKPVKTAGADDVEQLLTEVSYHLLLAARAIAARSETPTH